MYVGSKDLELDPKALHNVFTEKRATFTLSSFKCLKPLSDASVANLFYLVNCISNLNYEKL